MPTINTRRASITGSGLTKKIEARCLTRDRMAHLCGRHRATVHKLEQAKKDTPPIWVDAFFALYDKWALACRTLVSEPAAKKKVLQAVEAKRGARLTIGEIADLVDLPDAYVQEVVDALTKAGRLA